MKILKSYKFRLYPSNNQQVYLNQVFGSVRFVWNHLVANFNNYGTDLFVENMSEKTLKDEHTFLNESISYALQQKRIDFDSTKSQFFNKKRKVRLGRMKFKKKGIASDTFRIPGTSMPKSALSFDTKTIRLPKIGGIKCKYDRQPDGTLKSVTVSKTKTGKYFVSCLFEEESYFKPKTNQVVGIDLGLKELLTLSNGDVFGNPRWFRERQSKLAKAQRDLSRKKKGSRRYNKQKLKVARLHEKIKFQRAWYLHNISTMIVDNYDIICLEDLNIKGMQQGKLAKSIGDASLSELVRMIQYKSLWYGKKVIQVDRFFPSSKTCSCCGNIKFKLTLSERSYNCTECGTVIDRDLNASINILNQGLKILSDETTDYSCGEEIRLSECLHSVIASSMKRLETIK